MQRMWQRPWSVSVAHEMEYRASFYAGALEGTSRLAQLASALSVEVDSGTLSALMRAELMARQRRLHGASTRTAEDGIHLSGFEYAIGQIPSTASAVSAVEIVRRAISLKVEPWATRRPTFEEWLNVQPPR